MRPGAFGVRVGDQISERDFEPMELSEITKRDLSTLTGTLRAKFRYELWVYIEGIGVGRHDYERIKCKNPDLNKQIHEAHFDQIGQIMKEAAY